MASVFTQERISQIALLMSLGQSFVAAQMISLLFLGQVSEPPHLLA